VQLNLESINSNIHQLNVPEGFKSYSVEVAIEQIRKLGLDKELVEVYPQNIFTEKMIILYLFAEEKFTKVSFEVTEEEKNIIHIETNKYKNISLLKYSLSNEMVPFHQLVIKLESGEEVVLNNRNDTNSHWSNKFIKKIETIHELLK
jgi:hypothetical protein